MKLHPFTLNVKTFDTQDMEENCLCLCFTDDFCSYLFLTRDGHVIFVKGWSPKLEKTWKSPRKLLTNWGSERKHLNTILQSSWLCQSKNTHVKFTVSSCSHKPTRKSIWKSLRFSVSQQTNLYLHIPSNKTPVINYPQ